MRLIRHPLVSRDLAALVDHIVETMQGDFGAAGRRLDEIDNLLAEIVLNPHSGMRLPPPLDSWLVRHGGRGQRITLVFKASSDKDTLYVALVAFGPQDWIAEGRIRKGYADQA